MYEYHSPKQKHTTKMLRGEGMGGINHAFFSVPSVFNFKNWYQNNFISCCEMEIVFNAQSTMTVKAVLKSSWLPVPNSPCGLCGRKATFQEEKDESI